MSSSTNQGSTRKGFLPRWLVKVLAAAFLLAALLSVYLVYVSVRDLAAAWSETGLPSFQISGSGGGEEQDQAMATPVLLEELPEPWNGTDRVTILLMGLDYRDWSSGEGPPRTDSMMLATLDPVSLSAGMMSIPRDLWVEIPGYGHGRINTAYFLGERDRLPGGGPALAVETVENFLGVPIPYYVQIDFNAFVRFIDELGGVEINVPEEIRVDPIAWEPGESNTVLLEPGPQVLNGDVTLAYARARKTEGGDFDRAKRQQQVAIAIRDRILSLEMIPTLVAKAPNLYAELSSGIRTNLSLDQMLSLGMTAIKVDRENIRKGVIAPPNMVTLERVIYGGEEADVLKPVPDQIRILRDEIFTAEGALGPSIEVADTSEASELENARLAVLNGTGEEGLAGRMAEQFTALGFNVVEIANADSWDYPTSRIVDYTGNPYTTKYIADLLDLSQGQILFQTDPDAELDLAFVVGYDWPQLLPKLTAARE
jgi:LCP family protein required for cell wall assembly